MKKIIIVTETPPGTPNGFGVTLQNLFKELKHRVVYTDESFWSESSSDYKFAHCPNHQSKKLLPLFLLGLIPEWRGNYSCLWLFLNLRGKYDIVYSFFYSLENIKFAKWIASRKKARHIVHIADHCESFFKDADFREIINSSYKRATIGANMQEAYEKKFNLEFEVFHNSADSDKLPFELPKNLTFSNENPLKLLFIGSIFQSLHEGAIQDICIAVKRLYEDGKPIRFVMYGQVLPPDYLKEQIDGKSVFHFGKINVDQRFSIMQNHHAYVVPSSFDQKLSENYSYSIPTKLPELIGSGRPTIIYGTPQMEASRYCKSLKTGTLVQTKGIDALISVFSNLLLNYSNELRKAQSEVVRKSDQIFDDKYLKKFSDFVLL